MKKARNSSDIERIRERIIEAALDLIVEEGFPALTMRRLATRMHMSAPNLYNFFTCKEEIFISIVIKGFQMLYDELDQSYRSCTHPSSRAQSLIGAYVRFGMTNKAYYDVMFTRPTPKHDDSVGTPYEKLSAIEYRISRDIAALAMEALKGIIREPSVLSRDDIIHHMIKIWTMLHGMVSLANSNIMGYVAPDMDKTYGRIMQELVQQY